GCEAAVQDARPGRVPECPADRVREPQHLLERQPALVAAREEVLDRAATHQLADDERLGALLAHVVDGHDVGMVAEPAHGPRLAPHARQPCRVEPIGLDERDRDVALEPRVVRDVDALLAALADEAAHVVAAAAERGGRGSRYRRRLAADRLRREGCPAAAAELLARLGLEAAAWARRAPRSAPRA